MTDAKIDQLDKMIIKMEKLRLIWSQCEPHTKNMKPDMHARYEQIALYPLHDILHVCLLSLPLELGSSRSSLSLQDSTLP